MKKLIINKDFKPCEVLEDDELFTNGIFVFNISKLKEYLLYNPLLFIPETLEVDQLYIHYSSIDESHLENVDISEPIILGEIAPGKFNLIDGNHRMTKAYRDGIQKLKAYRIYIEHLQPFFTDEKAYLAHVKYWNDKLS